MSGIKVYKGFEVFAELHKKQEANDKSLLKEFQESLLNATYNYSTNPKALKKLISKIERAINNSELFGLRCDTSLIVFSPVKLSAYWFGKEISDFKYETIRHLIADVKFYLLTHKQFIPVSKVMIETKKRQRLLM